MAPRPAEHHPLHKLDWEAVHTIRRRAGLTPVRALARAYGVDPHTIRDVIQFKTWIPPEPDPLAATEPVRGSNDRGEPTT